MNAWAWVMLGGAVGAAARYGTQLALAPLVLRAGVPVAVLLINVVGSFLLGLTVALVGRGAWPETARLAFGTGVLGAFTTFSTFSVDLADLLGAGRSGAATLYALLSVLLGVLAAVLGRTLGARV
ncbi:CrcB protein [Deinococcus metalli]|uniref:Fluoride-specific ion channel FluC n=1 Tax=Deinococcus metalli TaxID=1141878 RepID=A0A7W8NSD2_9DEIO|nr:fluoride efflux transporter CrcB [Deinococcus metalli]MBB5378830.1 CrcB protein [Deinococcus metalli]GHF62010.1 putative fluoride ion transporter CrcB [Deinococcus metalli]